MRPTLVVVVVVWSGAGAYAAVTAVDELRLVPLRLVSPERATVASGLPVRARSGSASGEGGIADVVALLVVLSVLELAVWAATIAGAMTVDARVTVDGRCATRPTRCTRRPCR